MASSSRRLRLVAPSFCLQSPRRLAPALFLLASHQAAERLGDQLLADEKNGTGGNGANRESIGFLSVFSVASCSTFSNCLDLLRITLEQGENFGHTLLKRAVYQEASGKQYVVDDEGEKVHGVWYLPPEERIGPDAVVDADESP